MSDDQSETGGGDRQRIDIHEDQEPGDWSRKFNVSPDGLKQAVQSVGTSAEAVENHLREGT